MDHFTVRSYELSSAHKENVFNKFTRIRFLIYMKPLLFYRNVDKSKI